MNDQNFWFLLLGAVAVLILVLIFVIQLLQWGRSRQLESGLTLAASEQARLNRTELAGSMNQMAQGITGQMGQIAQIKIIKLIALPSNLPSSHNRTNFV